MEDNTVNRPERNEELRRQPGRTGLTPTQDIDPNKYKTGRAFNYTCPKCGKLLPEVITMGGKVRGWCGVTHQYVEDKVA
jgi:hypothetical protein